MGAGMWVEKYRPQELGDVAGQKEIMGSLGALLKKVDDMPHLLFSGPAGVGKTTAALCLAGKVLGERKGENLLELNASDERGIGMVREKVKKFSKFAGMGDIPFKIIILDEADEMTSDAQTALRRIIEDASEFCRFIIIANNVSKIIDPLQSRCASFKFQAVDEKEALARLADIAKKEKAKFDDAGIKAAYTRSDGDMRRSINLLQTAASMGGITAENIKASAGLSRTSDVDEILEAALAGKFSAAREKMVELIKIHGMSETDFLKYMCSSALRMNDARTPEIMSAMAEYDYRLIEGASPEIQLSAMLARLGTIK
ncbi:MAG: replication factor C small subunit [Nitrosopumilus sp.]|nr:replication factor C small subunit [Nitrosopumilus sp.]CAI9832357.1 Replication factor C small subunit [Nitrosopumilaceae archaeon]MDA7942016.1 replication factor C small subunit [Nitrosopumilus sp.]MDA7944065.1 replication factor C small subunit [Nitrosopumilus sp.]MDA7945587.1 replication factor C small subunit [Nitrosopumilus sp.]